MRLPAILLASLVGVSANVLADETKPVAPEETPDSFATFDVDGNGLVTYAEAEKSPSLASQFAIADTNGDGALTQEEFSSLNDNGHGK